MSLSTVKSEIRDGLITLIKSVKSGAHVFSAEVLDVDLKSRTCTVQAIDDHAAHEYSNIKLMPEVCDGLLYVPKKGSVVIVEKPTNLDPYIIMWSELEKIWLVAKDIWLNGDALGGLLKIEPTLDAINKIQKDVNSLKTALASLHTTLSTPPAAAAMLNGGALASALLTAGIAGPSPSVYALKSLAVTSRGEIENIAVMHGDGH